MCDTVCMDNSSEIYILKRKFLKHIEVGLGRSKKTIENYDRCLNSFIKHSEVTKVKDITKAVVKDYKKWLNSQVVYKNSRNITNETLKKKTQNYYLIALRVFLGYLRKQNITSLDSKNIKLAKVFNQAPYTINKDEVIRMLNASIGGGLKKTRDYALLQLLFSTKLTVSEVCSLNIESLSKKGISVIRKCSGACIEELSHEALNAMQIYLSMRVDVDESMFVSNCRRRSNDGSLRLTPRSVQRIVRHSAIKAGITKKVTPQTLRVYINK